MKLLAFGQAVNVTLGLPIVRTSVDHGTAFDIAGKGSRRSGQHDRGGAAGGALGNQTSGLKRASAAARAVGSAASGRSRQ